MRSTLPGRIGLCSRCAVCIVLSLLPMSSLRCYSADIVFIRSAKGSSVEQRQLEVATHFYGLNLDVVTAGSHSDGRAPGRAVERHATLAVVLAANALALVDQKALLRALNRRPGGSVPLLILGVTPETDVGLLRAWSGGAVVGCRRVETPRPLYVISHLEGFTQQLTDLELSFPGNYAVYFLLDENSSAQQVMKVRDDDRVLPVFIKTTIQQLRVFLCCTMGPSDGATAAWNVQRIIDAFAEIAPAMMFTKYSAGERGWHALDHYANLMIDDPWLREPYGYLNYSGLLAEMEKHNFHSTIAFIPWNYDRSDPGVVSVFRDHPDRFSICIHGDNHDHKEFTDYRTKPLPVQIDALKQSLARMDRFQMLTGIPYDKVMVFPHSIAPEKTLEALKTYNYLGTINSSNVPMDRLSPSLFPFALRPVTVAFADFASIRRYPVELPAPTGVIAMNAFLNNPLLFYCHQDFFANGIGAFNSVADRVNRLQPDTRWRSVGDIVRHLYLVKLRDDLGFDVLTFSGNFCLDNVSGRNSMFHVRKQENSRPAITTVTVDGRSFPYRLQDGYLELSIPIPADTARSVVIEYQNDLVLASVDISRNSLRVYLLRMASDFRDITLSRYARGLAFIRFYSKEEATPTQVLGCASLLLIFCAWGAWRLGRTSTSR